MNEKMPQKIDGLPQMDRTPSMEGTPTVENMIINGTSALIRVTFPRGEFVAKTFMLVAPPSSERGTENVKRLLEQTSNDKERKAIEHTFEVMNSPLVFQNREEMQRWFDLSKYTYDDATRIAIAKFLEIENTED